MQTIQGPIILVQKQRAIVFCKRCCNTILVTISSDGSWYGAHYCGYKSVTINDKYGWVCDECWEITYPKKEITQPKLKIGFDIQSNYA